MTLIADQMLRRKMSELETTQDKAQRTDADTIKDRGSLSSETHFKGLRYV